MKITKYLLKSGDNTHGFDMEFAKKVYDNTPLFRAREFNHLFLTISTELKYTDRWEYVVTDDNGSIIASMAFYRENDMHVGDCLSVLVAFSTDNRSLIGGYRWLIEIAKTYGVGWVAFTKKVADYEMKLVYKKVG